MALMTNETPEGILRGWAKAYRDTPEYRFPSDPDAEFFPVDLERAALEIVNLRCALALFLATDETMEGILWGKEPDTALVKISIPLGQYREARAAMTGIPTPVGSMPVDK